MSIPKYKSFAEKGIHFNIVRIDTIEEFQDIYNEHQRSQGIYRGINSSSYKIFTSKQREFFTKSANQDYLSVVKSDKNIREYFRLADIPMTALSLYSLLQHFGKPTPLIDFTKNFSKALFFALDEMNTDISTEEIDNYFSIFFISSSDLDLLDVSGQFNGAANYNKILKDHLETYEDCTEDLILKHTEDIVNIGINEVFLLERDNSYKSFVNIKNNHRVIIQEGVFVCNLYREDNLSPLEESLKLFLKEESERNYYSVWDEMDTNRPGVQQNIQEYQTYIDKIKVFQDRLCQNIITSYDINKSLVDDIKTIANIPDKELMYLDIGKVLEKV